MMLRKIQWFAMFSMAMIGVLAISAGISAAAPPADFLKATDTGSMSTPEATAMATEVPGAMATSSPSGGMLASPGATVQMSNVAKLGNILTDSAGMTLYVFKNDTPGTSNCIDTCAQNWPPLTIDEGQEPVAGTGVAGTLDFIDRSDGSYQVTYNGMPLYRFIGDKQPGDTNGQGLLNGAWSVVTLTAAAPAAPVPQATSSY
jgi:predicted lipoprotein with Yx(FWY)xxD motif